ncbi:C-5 cytosine-specific DNA methylase [Bacteroides uniformis]|uniref:DNA cytosine methyltransferase n=1 Tax=Bacteroides uniformis TaxID=820 RepID=UPI001BF03C76|nr:DNA cytosine methyltransferase [Bacteroides uniformis]QUT34413.1 C-5 cytosine-specific DNA methylase [Bacteroides uniformis]
MKLYSIDLFSGVGGLTQGLRKAGFQTKMAFEIDELASSVYKLNHKRTKVITDNIRNVSTEKVKKQFKGKTIHLLYNPQNEMFALFQTKRYFLQNETSFKKSFSTTSEGR